MTWVCDLYDVPCSCDKCGICRVGGRENYFHCDTCNCCYSVQLRNTHVCVQNSMACNCPVCFEYLFDSVKPINVMPCGHTIHQVGAQYTLHLVYVLQPMAVRAHSAALQSESWDRWQPTADRRASVPHLAKHVTS